MTATMNSRTVVTENPKTDEALNLRNYAKTAPILPTAILDHLTNNLIDGTRRCLLIYAFNDN